MVIGPRELDPVQLKCILSQPHHLQPLSILEVNLSTSPVPEIHISQAESCIRGKWWEEDGVPNSPQQVDGVHAKDQAGQGGDGEGTMASNMKCDRCVVYIPRII